MKHLSIRHYICYSLIVLFWGAVLAGLVYLPDLWKPSGKVLRILTWGNIIDPAYVRSFEKKTGITVAISYYLSNEELQMKLKKTEGKDYDLIVPSDYAVTSLSKLGLLKKLDKERMPFLRNINPLLLNHTFDPQNEYSVPFEWELYGIGFDQRFFKNRTFNASWGSIFEQPHDDYKIIMTNDSIEAIMCATQYLYGPREMFSPREIETVADVLQKQKQWVEAYSSTRAGYYLATGNSPLALTTTAYVWAAKKYASYIDFVLPREGGFITIENFAVPAATQNDDIIYRFMEFMYTMESALHHFHVYSNFPAFFHPDICAQLDEKIRSFLCMTSQDFQKLQFFSSPFSEELVQDIWVSVKA